MSAKKKATSKITKKKGSTKKMAVFDRHKEGQPQDQPQTTPPAKGQPIPAPTDPLQSIEEREAAAQEPTKKIDSGKVKPPQPKPATFQDKTPEELTGPEQEAVMTSGGVLPKEQHDAEAKAEQVATGQPVPPTPQPTVGQSPMDPPTPTTSQHKQ